MAKTRLQFLLEEDDQKELNALLIKEIQQTGRVISTSEYVRMIVLEHIKQNSEREK